MKTLLVALNAKYIHSNIAVRYLQKYAANVLAQPPAILELTINNRTDFILNEIFRAAPDVLLFSVYIWNVDITRQLAKEYRKLHPKAVIGVGGPEVSYESEDFLRDNPAFDLVVCGEGEETTAQLLTHLERGEAWHETLGITARSGSEIVSNPPQAPLDLALLPFPYAPGFSDTNEQIKYYESSRGCPFQCQYCLSSIEKGVRMAPLEKVFADLTLFLNAKVRQVKFVDRTFNCDAKRALAIWKFLREQDNGITNFHFEITAELLNQETLDFLGTVRKEQFQFEIGVQSTNPSTLKAIRRENDWPRLCAIVKRIKSFHNIHQHLDLIAGLPFEDYNSFHQSFNDVYALQPEQFQLGFLKLLKGAGLYRDQEKYGLVCRDYPPFEVLFTPALPYRDTLRLKSVEEAVERFYNSGRFIHSLGWITGQIPDPFLFFQNLGEEWTAKKEHDASLSLDQCYNFFYDFCAGLPQIEPSVLAQYLKLDYCLHQRPKRHPDWFPAPDSVTIRQEALLFLENQAQLLAYLPDYLNQDAKQIYKLVHFEPFSLDVLEQTQPCILLFDYRKRDLLGNAWVQKVKLSPGR